MRSQSIVLSSALLIASSLAFAGTGETGQAAHHPGTDSGQAMGMSGMSGCGMSMEQETILYQHIKLMRSQMSELMQTTDPARRQELMQEQMDNMNRMLQSMEQMHGSHSAMSQNTMTHGSTAMNSPETH